ncbi:MAG: hypothetical protein II816_00030, partial [Elusimicrobia bacterium]|nr:hypothetical protein [Elusimicrobiota bacterium]
MEKKFFLSKYLIFIILFMCGMFLSGTAVFAATDNVPKKINVQGRLTTDSGSPITGTKSVTLAIYSDSSGSSQVASKTNSSVNVDSEGLYTVNFDFASDNIDFNRQLYFKVTANGVESSVTPFAASPNAFYASTSTYALSLSTAEGADKLVSGNFTTYKGSEDPYIYEVKVDSATWADTAETANSLSSEFKLTNDNFATGTEYSNLQLANSNFVANAVYTTTTTWSENAKTVADNAITTAKIVDANITPAKLTQSDYTNIYLIKVDSATWSDNANVANTAEV